MMREDPVIGPVAVLAGCNRGGGGSAKLIIDNDEQLPVAFRQVYQGDYDSRSCLILGNMLAAIITINGRSAHISMTLIDLSDYNTL